MLRSKFHRPWQPRVSDSQLLNPSAHTTESNVSFSESIRDIEESVVEPGAPETRQEAAPSSEVTAESLEAPSAATPQSAPGKWYASLVGRFAKH